MSEVLSCGSLAVASTFLGLVWYRKRRARLAPLPPGPEPWPYVGNIQDLRPEQLWLTASEWARKYGACSSYVDVGCHRRVAPYHTSVRGDLRVLIPVIPCREWILGQEG